jgi:hypothetical protein
MMITQKLLFQLLIAAVAFGAVTCPCPALAASEPQSHAEHQSQMQSPVPSEACQHSECVTDCSLIPVDSSEQDAMPCKGKYQFDDFDAIPPEFIPVYQPVRFSDRTHPPPYQRMANDTPVHRFDRLLE